MSEVDALVAAAAAQAGVGASSAAPASSEGYETSEGGVGAAGPVAVPDQAPPPPADEPQVQQPQQADSEPVPVLGTPDRFEPADEPTVPSEQQHVPLAVLLKERDQRQAYQRQLEAIEAEKAELARWRQEYEPVLDEARQIWPEMQQQAARVPALMQELDRLNRMAEFYKSHATKAKDEYGLEFDEGAFLKDMQLQQALAKIENLDTTINSALAAQFNEREAMFARHQQEAAQREAAERDRRDRDQRFEQQFGDLVKAAPALKNFRHALRTEFDANPMVPLRETAGPLVQSFSAQNARAADQAASMVRTQGAASGSRPQLGSGDESARYAGMGVKEIIAQRKAELRRAGLL